MMKKNVTVTHLGMTGMGANRTEALKDAQARIEATLSGQWDPYVLVHGNLVALITRKPVPHDMQWGFKVVDTTTKDPVGNQWVDCNYRDRPEALRAAAYSLAQRADTYEGLSGYLTETQLYELDYYFDWQRAYRLHSGEGRSDAEARAAADKVMENLRKAA
ncbi:hypothetical protein WJ96_05220 [Burkholderia ubonensis]|uniref:Uncharacterized protein n=2 Tax=Burkholderia ubonensis TaxID=101571 RepID=A0AAW3MTN9_9BURK|nr:hypothetical protein WJ96_05220 [Burkholderia ubonensis]KVZ92669.1 hypothetical protein WL25_16875 [Burkholderia ubonensis]